MRRDRSRLTRQFEDKRQCPRWSYIENQGKQHFSISRKKYFQTEFIINWRGEDCICSGGRRLYIVKFKHTKVINVEINQLKIFNLVKLMNSFLRNAPIYQRI